MILRFFSLCRNVCLPALFLLAATLHVTPAAVAQTEGEIHSPAQLLKIMEESSLTYNLGILEQPVPCTAYKEVIADNSARGAGEAGGKDPGSYTLKEEEQALFNQGRAHFRNGAMGEARSVYFSLLKLRPDFAPAMTFLGQTYEAEHDYKNAIKCLEAAITLNYHDYLAHYFLADDYAATGDYKRAASEIILASILNRNNTNIRTAMARILPKAGFKTADWCFEPQVYIGRKADSSVDVQFGENWVGYAVAKAIWTFEPGYSAANGGAPEGRYNTAADKECLAVLAMSLINDEKKSWKKKPELNALMRSFDKKLFMEFLYYEVMLPKYPHAVYQLPAETLNSVRDYVMTVRLK
jgi:tetratricopeptide (TPR) repeat protein